jgi:hypothetical protein
VEFIDFIMSVRAFVRECEPLSLVLIIFDTLARSMIGGDENSARDMGLVLDAFRRVRSEFPGCCCLAVGHPGKDEKRGIRGSSLIEGNVDTIIEIEASALNTDTGAPAVRATSRKVKDGEAFRPFRLTLTEQPCCIGPDDTPTESLVIAPNAIEKAPLKSKPGSKSYAAATARQAYKVITDRIIHSSERPPSLSEQDMPSLFAHNGVINSNTTSKLQSQAAHRIMIRLQDQNAVTVKDGRVLLGKNRLL